MIGNTTDGGRGGALWGKDFLLSNCLLAFNQSLEAGAIYSEPTFDPTRLVNCTLYGNSAEDTGGIVAHRAVYSDLYLSVVNSILWNPGAEIKSDSWSASYSDIQGGATGEGNINAYPLFQDIGEKDFRLLNGSPCIDRGSGEAILASADLQGASRIQGEGIDIGALESPGDYEAGDPVSITRIYVKTGGADNGPGDSWENAFGSINAAMAWATDGTEIWVQGGDYSEPIVLEEGVSLYGGFSGTETSLSERVPQSNPTRLLGGDFFGSIVLGAGIRSATLDGFTVAGGRSDSGGGINLSGPGSYTVANCRIVDNTSEEEGGGIFCGDGAEVSILHCSIDNNAAEGNGGGVYMGKDSILHFENSQVDSNLAVNGAGIYASLSAGEIADSTFENNHATANSGGAFFSGNLIFSNCLFKGNVATDFGGVQLSGEGAINLNRCRVLSNEARSKGGGIGLTGMASPTFKLTQVSDNQARFGGGLFVADRSLPVFEDCGILRNHAVYRESISPPLGSGGGIYAGGAQLTLRRSLISENTGDYQGGGLFGSHSAYLVQGCTMTRNQGLYGGGVYLWGVPVSPYPTSSFTSCLFAKNRAERFSNIPDGGAACLANDAPAIFENCTLVDNRAKSVGGIGGGILSVTNCILWNEGIEIDSSHVTVSNSSCQGGCYGNGNQYGFPQFKDVLNGDCRLTSGSPCIDRGSAPSNPDPAEVDLDGLSRIQNGIVDIGCYEALEGAQSGPVDEVRSPLYVVHGGTGKNLGGNWEDAFPDIHSALLVSTTGAEIWIAEGEYRESLTVEKGVSLYGGFTGSESSLTERDYGNHFTVIDATGLGRSVMSIPKAVQCVVDGLTLTGGDPGGGIHCDDLSDSVLRNLIVTGNRSEISGAIHMSPNSRAFMENCLLSRNKATRGGAMSIQYAKVEMVHCTLAANSALEGAAIIVTGGGAEPKLRVWNSILWNEGPSEIIAYPSAGVIQIENSQVRLAWPGAANSTVDPEFINYADGDFRLSESSPCIDTAKPNLAVESLNGVTRPVDIPGVGADGEGRGYDRGPYERPLEGHPTFTPTLTPTPTVTPTSDFDLVRDGLVNALDLFELLKQTRQSGSDNTALFEFSLDWMTSNGT
ncbi:MAG: right-handed parallel beta-helix repeat-containing protein [Candidatus Omnitrophica bacterium]|nr:right-handed parallel beta-helix repeat-containing protein [Candidatus Omnitrophota bacterium]